MWIVLRLRAAAVSDLCNARRHGVGFSVARRGRNRPGRHADWRKRPASDRRLCGRPLRRRPPWTRCASPLHLASRTTEPGERWLFRTTQNLQSTRSTTSSRSPVACEIVPQSDDTQGIPRSPARRTRCRSGLETLSPRFFARCSAVTGPSCGSLRRRCGPPRLIAVLMGRIPTRSTTRAVRQMASILRLFPKTANAARRHSPRSATISALTHSRNAVDISGNRRRIVASRNPELSTTHAYSRRKSRPSMCSKRRSSCQSISGANPW